MSYYTRCLCKHCGFALGHCQCKHNHITRDIKPVGECKGCDLHHQLQALGVLKDEPEIVTTTSTEITLKTLNRPPEPKWDEEE